MWIRMWFADGDKLHRRGYTLVDPNPELRLGGLRQPHRPRGGEDLPRGVLHPAQVD
jgi:hypothetical protein